MTPPASHKAFIDTDKSNISCRYVSTRSYLPLRTYTTVLPFTAEATRNEATNIAEMICNGTCHLSGDMQRHATK